MARDELELRKHEATEPADPLDPARFSQLAETTADAFVLELRKYFNRAQTVERITELPTIDKYAMGWAPGQDPLETVIQIAQDNPDLIENLPHVAVTAVSATNRPIAIGRPFVAQTQLSPRLLGSLPEPYALTDGATITYRTKPDGVNWVASTIVLRAQSFPTGDPITAALAADVVRVINNQALYARASISSGGNIQLTTGGPGGGRTTPNAIEITGGTALAALGFTIGQTDNDRNPERPPMNCYAHSADMQVSIDVIAEDPNTRREVTDLVYGFLTFWAERKLYQFFGRATFDEAYPDDDYHIILGGQVRLSPPQSTARPEDGKDFIHVQRIDCPCVTTMYIHRPVLVPYGPSTGQGWRTEASDLTPDDDLPKPT